MTLKSRLISIIETAYDTTIRPKLEQVYTDNDLEITSEQLTAAQEGWADNATVVADVVEAIKTPIHQVVGVSATHLLVDTDYVVEVDTTAGALTVTLPDFASSELGKVYKVVKTSADGNSVTIDVSGSDTLNGGTSFVLALQYNFTEITRGVSEWLIM